MQFQELACSSFLCLSSSQEFHSACFLKIIDIKDLLLHQELNELNIVIVIRVVSCEIQRRLIKIIENIDFSPMLDKNLRCLLISTPEICPFLTHMKTSSITIDLQALCIGYSFLQLDLLM